MSMVNGFLPSAMLMRLSLMPLLAAALGYVFRSGWVDWATALNQPCRDFGLAPAAFDVQVRGAVRVRFQADRPGRQGRSVSYAKTAAGAGQPDAPGDGRFPGETGIGLLYHAFPPFCGIEMGRSKLNNLVLALLRPSGGSLAPVAQSVKPFAARLRLS